MLIISFSGFPGCGKKPSFNYVRTLKDINVNKLFLMDDFGYPEDLGSYYLGENGDWFLPQEIGTLINHITESRSIKTIIMIGSSKGGTSALQYAIRCHAQFAVIGAPQYFIGNYLNTEQFKPIMQAICADDSERSVNTLNRLMPDLIKENRFADKPVVFIHYSPQEHTYPEHIKDMIADLSENGYSVEEDNDYSYTNHQDVAKYFPPVLHRKIIEIIQASK